LSSSNASGNNVVFGVIVKCPPGGQFHQSFFAKQKVARAKLLAKNSPFNFTNILPQIALMKFVQY